MAAQHAAPLTAGADASVGGARADLPVNAGLSKAVVCAAALLSRIDALGSTGNCACTGGKGMDAQQND